MPRTFLIVNDHGSVREALKRLLEGRWMATTYGLQRKKP